MAAFRANLLIDIYSPAIFKIGFAANETLDSCILQRD